MKISGLDPGWLHRGVQRPEAPGGAADGFTDLLHQALRESTDAPAAALGPAPAPALQSVDPAAAVQTATRLESFLDLLEYYQQQLAKELQAMANSEMWLAGKATRALRPAEGSGAKPRNTRGVAGRLTY
jgi:hypothetical protein